MNSRRTQRGEMLLRIVILVIVFSFLSVFELLLYYGDVSKHSNTAETISFREPTRSQLQEMRDKLHQQSQLQSQQAHLQTQAESHSEPFSTIDSISRSDDEDYDYEDAEQEMDTKAAASTALLATPKSSDNVVRPIISDEQAQVSPSLQQQLAAAETKPIVDTVSVPLSRVGSSSVISLSLLSSSTSKQQQLQAQALNETKSVESSASNIDDPMNQQKVISVNTPGYGWNVWDGTSVLSGHNVIHDCFWTHYSILARNIEGGKVKQNTTVCLYNTKEDLNNDNYLDETQQNLSINNTSNHSPQPLDKKTINAEIISDGFAAKCEHTRKLLDSNKYNNNVHYDSDNDDDFNQNEKEGEEAELNGEGGQEYYLDDDNVDPLSKIDVYLHIGTDEEGLSDDFGICIIHTLLTTSNTNVVAFESNPQHLFHLTSTLLQLDPWYRKRVTLFPISLSDTSSNSTLMTTPTSPLPEQPQQSQDSMRSIDLNVTSNSTSANLTESNNATIATFPSLSTVKYTESLDSVIKPGTHIALMNIVTPPHASHIDNKNVHDSTCSLFHGMTELIPSVDIIQFELPYVTPEEESRRYLQSEEEINAPQDLKIVKQNLNKTLLNETSDSLTTNNMTIKKKNRTYLKKKAEVKVPTKKTLGIQASDEKHCTPKHIFDILTKSHRLYHHSTIDDSTPSFKEGTEKKDSDKKQKKKTKNEIRIKEPLTKKSTTILEESHTVNTRANASNGPTRNNNITYSLEVLPSSFYQVVARPRRRLRITQQVENNEQEEKQDPK